MNNVLNAVIEYLETNDVEYELNKKSIIIPITTDGIEITLGLFQLEDSECYSYFASLVVQCPKETVHRLVLLLNLINNRMERGAFTLTPDYDLVVLRGVEITTISEFDIDDFAGILSSHIHTIDLLVPAILGLIYDKLTVDEALEQYNKQSKQIY